MPGENAGYYDSFDCTVASCDLSKGYALIRSPNSTRLGTCKYCDTNVNDQGDQCCPNKGYINTGRNCENVICKSNEVFNKMSGNCISL